MSARFWNAFALAAFVVFFVLPIVYAVCFKHAPPGTYPNLWPI